MIIHHYSATELKRMIAETKGRVEALIKVIHELDERASYTPYFRVGGVDVDSIAYLNFLDSEKEKFQKEQETLEKQLFTRRRDLE